MYRSLESDVSGSVYAFTDDLFNFVPLAFWASVQRFPHKVIFTGKLKVIARAVVFGAWVAHTGVDVTSQIEGCFVPTLGSFS